MKIRKKHLKISLFIVCIISLLVPIQVFAYDPPLGSETSSLLTSPLLSSGSNSVAGYVSPSSTILNPASAGLEQRLTFDAAYTGLFGSASGSANVIALSAIIPQPYGVWASSISFLSSNIPELPLGNIFSGSVGMSKSFTDKLLLGTAIDFALGSNNGFGWGLAMDLGVTGNVGNLSFMRDFVWALAFRNIGKSFNSASSRGFNGSSPASSYDSPFTPQLGASATMLNVSKMDLKLGMNMDIMLPSFQNLVFLTGLQLTWKDMVWLKAGWDINLRETIAGSAQSLIPSFGIGFSIRINKDKDDSIISKAGLNRSEINPSFAFAPISNSVNAYSTGITVPIGVIDKKAPVITITYPETQYDAYYFSPNNDGIKDLIVLPITITDQRYVKSFALKVLDEDGNVIKTIANKETRPENFDFKGILNKLTYVDKGVVVPQSLEWNGLKDSGELAPDGKYYITVEAVDDNDNASVTEPWAVVLDTVVPDISLVIPQAQDELIFSPDGDGRKDTFVIKQTGSNEDLWSISILDASMNVLRNDEQKNTMPSSYTWDGKNNESGIVPDGVYSYSISSTDRAGNSCVSKMENILVNTEQATINMTIDMANFSPNDDGNKDKIIISPIVPVKNGIKSWELSVFDKSNNEVWTKNGTKSDSLLDSFVFDGKTESGSIMPEGTYKTKLSVLYENGHNPETYSPQFTLDVTKPKAEAVSSKLAFNPLGDADRAILINQKTSSEETWNAKIVNADGKAVKEWSFVETVDEELSWDGSDEAGKVVPDGVYSYVLSSVDKAGNYGEAKLENITVNTEAKAVRLALSSRAFSPNADNSNDSISFNPESQSSAGIRHWNIDVYNSESMIVKSFSQDGKLPKSILWNGKGTDNSVVKDGKYYADLKVTFVTGEVEFTRSIDFSIDTVSPSVELKVESTIFDEMIMLSPDGDGKQDNLEINQRSVSGDKWLGKVLDSSGNVVSSWIWNDEVPNLLWNGTDNEGNNVPDGKYSYVISSTDIAGNKTEKTIQNIIIDRTSTPIFITASGTGLSPNGDNVFDTISFCPVVKINSGLISWKIDVVDSTGKNQKTFNGIEIPEKIEWDGKNTEGNIVEDKYTAVFTAKYRKGNEPSVSSSAFILDISAPKVKIDINPKYFSPDNDGIDDELSLEISVEDASSIDSWSSDVVELSVVEGKGKRNERVFYNWNGKGTPSKKITWDGKSQKGELVEAASDYPLRFTISDVLGNKTTISETISVDVLVIRDGNKLKIKVPSIVFRSSGADFKGLAKEVVASNEDVLKRIAVILNRFKGYSIQVEGHANSIAKIYSQGAEAVSEEEIKTLLPLSKARAEQVMKKLIEFGVDSKRLSSVGLGSSEPVVDFTDATNRWKNRRVEFILIKE